MARDTFTLASGRVSQDVALSNVLLQFIAQHGTRNLLYEVHDFFLTVSQSPKQVAQILRVNEDTQEQLEDAVDATDVALNLYDILARKRK